MKAKAATNVENSSHDASLSFRLHHSSFQPPPPPWELEGAAVVFVHGWRSVLALVRYDCSPVGSYEELAVITLTGRGPTVVEMFVNSTASMIGGRRGWGFPKQLGALKWEQTQSRILFQAGARTYRVRFSRLAVPLKLKGWCWQVLDGRRVYVAVRVAGKAHIGWQGRRIALVIEALKFEVLRPGS